MGWNHQLGLLHFPTFMVDYLWWQTWVNLPFPWILWDTNKFWRQQVQHIYNTNIYCRFSKRISPKYPALLFLFPPLNILETSLGEYTIPINPTCILSLYIYIPRKPKPTKLCPLVGSGILNPWIILKTSHFVWSTGLPGYIFKHTLRETNSSHLKMDGWNTSFL